MATEREIEAAALAYVHTNGGLHTCIKAALEAAERERDKTKPIPFLPFEEQWD